MAGDSHLSRPAVTDWLKRHSYREIGTALHIGKDFAVAPPRCRRDYPQGISLFFRREPFLFAPLGSLRTGVTRYRAPVVILDVFGLSSPHLSMRATV